MTKARAVNVDDFSLFWSILVPGAVLLLTVSATAKIYLDVTRK